MKKTITLIAAVLMLCCMAQAQISYVNGINMGETSAGNNGLSVSFAAPAGTSAMAVCIIGDTIGGHDDIVTPTWNSESFTLVKKWTGPQGSHSNNRYQYLYKLINPTPDDGTSHTLTFSSTNSHYILAAAAEYGGVLDIGATYSEATGPISGTSHTQSWGNSLQTSVNGSWNLMCEGNGDSSHPTAATGGDVLRVVGGNGGISFDFPVIIDSGGPINPQRTVNNEYWMYITFDALSGDGQEVLAEMTPIVAQFGSVQATYTSSNSWVFNASASGLPSCDYSVSAWDTTTTPYTQLTPTSNTCDGSYNVTLGFSANQTGTMVIVPNANKCGTGTC